MSRAARAVSLLVAGLSLVGFRGEHATVTPSARVRVSAGAFTRGSDTAAVHRAIAICRNEHRLGRALGACEAELFAPELPLSKVYLPAFDIDRFEVTRAEYARCVSAGACMPPRLGEGDDRLGQARFPVVGVTAHDAEDYCRFVGGRLPSDDEWEKAARGMVDARTFPWGEVWDRRLANHGAEEGHVEAGDGARYLAEVGSYPEGVSPFGLHDVAGNAWEWTSSAFSPGVRSTSEPAPASVRSIRGGSFRTTALMMRVAFRAGLSASDYTADVGFRCAYDGR